MSGVEGEDPETVAVENLDTRAEAIRANGRLRLASGHDVGFHNRRERIMNKRSSLPAHPNGMRFNAFTADGNPIMVRTFHSGGGDFVVEPDAEGHARIVEDATPQRYPFYCAARLLQHCVANAIAIAISDAMHADQRAWRGDAQINAGLLCRRSVMPACIERGSARRDPLPGGMQVRCQACRLAENLNGKAEQGEPLEIMDWVTLYALAVSEENASDARVVIAPTNGAAGIIPAVLNHYVALGNGNNDGVARLVLMAAAIGLLHTENASISGAGTGCQDEVDVACSMAAGSAHARSVNRPEAIPAAPLASPTSPSRMKGERHVAD